MCATCPDPIPAAARELLLPAEEQFAATLDSSDRCREWIAGRILIAAALSSVSAPRLPILTLRSGAPSVPTGFSGSISHKGPLTVAFAAVAGPAVGIDVECVEANDLKLATRVLTDTERSRIHDLDDASAGLYVTALFALKEAIFKALREEDQAIVDFENLEIAAPAAQLVPRVWTAFEVSVEARTSSLVRAAVFQDQRWIVAAASRQ